MTPGQCSLCYIDRLRILLTNDPSCWRNYWFTKTCKLDLNSWRLFLKVILLVFYWDHLVYLLILGPAWLELRAWLSSCCLDPLSPNFSAVQSPFLWISEALLSLLGVELVFLILTLFPRPHRCSFCSAIWPEAFFPTFEIRSYNVAQTDLKVLIVLCLSQGLVECFITSVVFVLFPFFVLFWYIGS